LVHILDGYADVLESLNLEDSDSEVDKVVKWILDQNILVRQLNVSFSRLTKTGSMSFNQAMSSIKSVKTGRYTRGEFGEDALIIKSWEELTKAVPINNPQKCIEDFSKIRSSDGKLKLKKRNVLGCFLGKYLKAIRHATDIFEHGCKLINPGSTGKFSKEEDQIILEEVKNCGETFETWKNLAQKLERTDRRDHCTIKNRYSLLTQNNTLHRGRWNLTEDEILIEALFEGQKVKDIATIESIDFNELKRVAGKLNRPWDAVQQRWNRNLKPVLLSYHYGTLHKPWRVDFLKYVVGKKIVGEQDLDFAELKLLFPEQTPRSLKSALGMFAQKCNSVKKPLYEIVQDSLSSKYKDVQETERLKTFREEIVKIYDRVISGGK
jgi:hypothetical protein